MQRRKLLTPLIGLVTVAVVALAVTLLVGNRPKLGLDLQGGASVVLKPSTKVDQATLNQTISIIRRRVDALGVAEPEISRQGDNVLVELPGVKDQQRALEVVGQTAELRFRPVLAALGPAPATASTSSTTAPSSTSTAAGTTTTAVSSATTVSPGGAGSARPLSDPATTAASSSSVTTAAPVTTAVGPTVPASTIPVTIPTQASGTPTTPADQDDPTKTVVLEQQDKKGNVIGRLALGPVAFTGDVIETASSAFSQSTNQWEVLLTLKAGASGIDKWNALAAECYGGGATCPSSGGAHGRIAIVLDHIVQSAPTVQTPTFQRDQISISGAFTEGETKDLALVLRFGALPVQLKPEAVNTVSATLGKDSLRAGIVAGLVGLALVLALMLLYYRSLGLVVFLGLLVSASLLWSIISYLGESRGLALTLAGATGIIVSIGVTVDSYVVFFERLKDDVHAGKTLRTSAQRGFQSAYRTILAADLVSFIGALVLWKLTVGSVRGFAFFLGLSTLLDLITAYFFTRPLVILLSRSDHFNRGKVLGLQTAIAVGAGATR
ncbi:MAG: protein translocase subunit SecD [Acidimicrobiales bacterium]